MYEKFFSLAHRPFAAAPNLECIVAHQGYVDAREKLLRCLTDGCGTAIVTAPAGLYDFAMEMDSTTTGCVGISVAGSPSVPIFMTTSLPAVTLPITAYSGGSCASGAVTTKNWLPDVPGASDADFAIATVPNGYFVDGAGGSTVW